MKTPAIEVMIMLAASRMYADKNLMKAKNLTWSREDCWLMSCSYKAMENIERWIMKRSKCENN